MLAHCIVVCVRMHGHACLYLVCSRVSLSLSYSFCHAWYSGLSDFWANDCFLFASCFLGLQLCISTSGILYGFWGWNLGGQTLHDYYFHLVNHLLGPLFCLFFWVIWVILTQAMWYNGMLMECNVSDLWSGFHGWFWGRWSDFSESLKMRCIFVVHGTWHVIDPFKWSSLYLCWL